jgi:hypothetical protein
MTTVDDINWLPIETFDNIGVIRKVSLCFDRFGVHYSHKPMETQSKALEFRGIIHKARV